MIQIHKADKTTARQNDFFAEQMLATKKQLAEEQRACIKISLNTTGILNTSGNAH